MFHQHWKKTIIWIIITLEYIRSDLEVKPLNYANIFLEHINNCYLYNEQIDITLIVGLNDPIDQITRQNFMTNHIEPSVQNIQLILDLSKLKTVKTCPTAVFKLEELTFVPLQTENHYIIIPAKNVQM
uniref:uncharacterized protein LOC117160351 n=1 Tax=Bombus vancouverensis nearcticus TaxID=2705178 RepID=UPI001438D4FF|nr:uncharacterized protein LOC117160351 [Bombus vancouverensis nearcticus]